MINKLKERIGKGLPRWSVLAVDVLITLHTFVGVIVLLHLLGVSTLIGHPFVSLNKQLAQVFVFSIMAYWITSSFKGVVRYTGLRDVVLIFKANAVYLLLMFASSYVLKLLGVSPEWQIGWLVLVMHFFMNSAVLILLRILYRAVFHSVFSKAGGGEKTRVLIYGAGVSGAITRRALIDDTQNNVQVIGFIDDDHVKANTTIEGIRVFLPETITKEFIIENNINEVIISIQNLSAFRMNEIMNQFLEMPVELKSVPPVSDWYNGALSTNQIRKVKVEDLLGRNPINLNKAALEDEYTGKVVMVTGAAGSIGSEISRQLMRFSVEKLIMLDQAESALYDLQQTSKCNNLETKDKFVYVVGNVRNEQKMNFIFNHYKPDIVFHAAAYKHVPLMEDYPYEAMSTNVGGTKIVADLSVKHGVEKFVMVSTDKAVNPTNVMGATKRVAELYTTHLNKLGKTRFVVTRFGNVLGSNGSVIPLFKRQLENGGPLTVTHPEITRFFMTIPEACQLVLEAGAMGQGGEVFVFDMGKSVKIIDLAKKMILLSGLRYPEDISIQITGLRPGEKIYEELLADDENTIPTHHPKIMIARVNEAPDHLEDTIDKMLHIKFSVDGDELMMEIVGMIKSIVPEYVSQNSMFEEIDQK